MENKLKNLTRHGPQSTLRTRVLVGPNTAERTDPTMRLNRRGGRIESIVINCTCGEEITVVCNYDEPTAPS